MRVGLCWCGSPTHRNDFVRSLPRSAVAPLALVKGVEWISLARDAWTPDLGDAGLLNGLEGCVDWYDTARALMGQPPPNKPPPGGQEIFQPIDLVITVDTAIAHLAGGLGIPTWILLAAVPDMRWMLNRTDSPWYRSVRLYRQAVAGDWHPVIERVTLDLQAEVYARRYAEAA